MRIEVEEEAEDRHSVDDQRQLLPPRKRTSAVEGQRRVGHADDKMKLDWTILHHYLILKIVAFLH